MKISQKAIDEVRALADYDSEYCLILLDGIYTTARRRRIENLPQCQVIIDKGEQDNVRLEKIAYVLNHLTDDTAKHYLLEFVL